ncbi:hypothetical protein [Streptomyces goshikiensis]|uniref:hypothetical protein n=1 Tax=Streptomyces goshikiensis TaxID=1942 RepID=UPI0036681139
MDTSMLRHPLIAQTVEALVADGGGVVTYDQGMGGRETLVAAAAALAARTGAPLTIVESSVMHDDTRATVAALQPDVRCTVISARDAERQPAPTPRAVLAVHADQLIHPDVRRPLLDLARATDHLLVVRHAYSDTTLDDLAGPAHTLDHREFMRLGPIPNDPRIVAVVSDRDQWVQSFAPAYVPPPMEQREGRLARQGGPTGAELDLAELEADADEDTGRLLAQAEESFTAIQQAAEQRATEARDRLLRAAQERTADPSQPHAPTQQDQRQATAHQHHTPGGRAPGQ